MPFLSKKFHFSALLLLSSFWSFCQLPSLVTISQGKFVSDGKPWFSVGVNYKVDLFTEDENTYWVGPHHGYSKNNERCCNNQLDARMALFSDFARIHDLGFNTIRICGMELRANDNSADKKLWINGKRGKSLQDIPVLSSKKNNKMLASMAKIIVEEAQDAGLQVIFLTGSANLERNSIQDKYNEWLEILCDSLKKTAPVLAIDLYNEPIYSGSSKLNKNELLELTKKWSSTVRKRLPKSFTTIGLVGPEDVVGWDPEALAIDFVSYHLYPTKTDFEYVAAALHWVSKTAKKPWILGETGYGGSDDSTQTFRQGSAADQRRYAEFSLHRAVCAGAQGYGWWMYREVLWSSEVNNMGLVDHQGKEKPIADFFRLLDLSKLPKTAPLPDDLHYYRMEYTDYVVSGAIEDEKGMPIPDAVVCGWDSKWQNFRWTVTQKNGTFCLGSYAPIKFVSTSALGRMVFKRTIVETDKVLKLKTVVLSKLEF